MHPKKREFVGGGSSSSSGTIISRQDAINKKRNTLRFQSAAVPGQVGNNRQPRRTARRNRANFRIHSFGEAPHRRTDRRYVLLSSLAAAAALFFLPPCGYINRKQKQTALAAAAMNRRSSARVEDRQMPLRWLFKQAAYTLN